MSIDKAQREHDSQCTETAVYSTVNTVGIDNLLLTCQVQFAMNCVTLWSTCDPSSTLLLFYVLGLRFYVHRLMKMDGTLDEYLFCIHLDLYRSHYFIEAIEELCDTLVLLTQFQIGVCSLH